jgi:hypothetical protein
LFRVAFIFSFPCICQQSSFLFFVFDGDTSQTGRGLDRSWWRTYGTHTLIVIVIIVVVNDRHDRRDDLSCLAARRGGARRVFQLALHDALVEPTAALGHAKDIGGVWAACFIIRSVRIVGPGTRLQSS